MKVLVAQPCPTPCNCSLCPWNSQGKDTRVDKPFASPGDLPDPGIKLGSPALQTDS